MFNKRYIVEEVKGDITTTTWLHGRKKLVDKDIANLMVAAKDARFKNFGKDRAVIVWD